MRSIKTMLFSCCCTPLSIVFVASSPSPCLVYCDGFNAAWNDWVFRQCRKMMTPFSQVSHLLLVHNVCGSSHATMHRKETKEVAFVLLPKLVLIIHLFFTKMHWQSTDFFTSIAGWHSFFRGFREQSWKTEFFNQVSKSERSELTDFNGFFCLFSEEQCWH